MSDEEEKQKIREVIADWMRATRETGTLTPILHQFSIHSRLTFDRSAVIFWVFSGEYSGYKVRV